MLDPFSQRKGSLSFLHSGSVWEQGSVSTVVIVFLWEWGYMFPACSSSRSLPLSTYQSVSLRGWEVQGFCAEDQQKRDRKSEAQRECQLEEVFVCLCVWGQQRAPSSLAIAAHPFAFCPLPAPVHSSGSRSGASGDARAPAPSTARPALHHCPGQSLSAWGRRRWERAPASCGLVGGRGGQK